MHNQPSKDDVLHLFICQMTSQFYFDELSIFEYSKTEFSFQSALASSLSPSHAIILACPFKFVWPLSGQYFGHVIFVSPLFPFTKLQGINESWRYGKYVCPYNYVDVTGGKLHIICWQALL